jgi:transcriptional regulator with XRE-family HTH domain
LGSGQDSVEVLPADAELPSEFTLGEASTKQQDAQLSVVLLLVTWSARFVLHGLMLRHGDLFRQGEFVSAPELALAIRAIRKRRGETMVQFGERLGCANSVVSRYESGILTPSRSMLLLIYRLADTPAEKAAIEAALGGAPDALDPRITDADAALRGALKDLRLKEQDDLASRAIWDRLAEQFNALTDRSGVPLWLMETLHLWLIYRDIPEAQREFEASYLGLSRRLELLAPSVARATQLGRPAVPFEIAAIRHGRKMQAGIQDYRSQYGRGQLPVGTGPPFARSDPRYREQVLWLMMNCPDEHKPFYTNFSMTQEKFDMVEIEGRPITCPVCGIVHKWGKKDVYLALPSSK